MTMPRGASRALYAGNGQAAEFPFFFKVFEEDQLSVLITSPAGVTSAAAGWTAELDDGGGTVRYLHNGAPLPEGWKLAIMRDMPFVQEVDLITGTRFDPEVIETALDVATAERQQLLERLDRAIVVEPTDEAGPEALLADIRDARTSTASSATSAAANANAAADAARAAAGSASIATEEREAACMCAGEARDARDVAIAQAEAANTLMEAELSKVNAIVAANRTDQQAAVTAARAWAEKAPDTPVDYDEEGNPRYSARHWAENAQKIAIEPPTPERRGAVRVGDGLTLATGENGETDLLAVSPDLGARLQLNYETWLTVSGTFTAPVTGTYEVLCIGGGQGAYATNTSLQGGDSGELSWGFARLVAGEAYPVTVGAGGSGSAAAGHAIRMGGKTSFAPAVFEDMTPAYPGAQGATLNSRSRMALRAQILSVTTSFHAENYIWGAGLGGGYNTGGVEGYNGLFFGAGGSVRWNWSTSSGDVGKGAQGAVRLRWHDPSRGAGPLPALFAARRMAAPGSAVAPVTVNLYDPGTGQGSVWLGEDAEAMLAGGLVSEAAWREICAEKAAEERAAWLADTETEAERFAMLRAARDARLAATDYLMVPDYPLTEEWRAAVTAYRQALRDLPAQEGAPWDGGGELTPWPAKPACCGTAPAAAAEGGNASCA